jgi:hypothetical protein
MKLLSFLLASSVALSGAGCLAPPPCPEPATAAGTTASTSTSASSSASDNAGPSDPGDLSKPLIVWDGDDVSPTAKEWASCDTQPCTTTLSPAPKIGTNGSIGLEFKAVAKSGYVGFGWNWTSWYAGGATNITGRKTLKFSIQIIPASLELAPAGDGIRVRLGCAKVEKCGKVVGSIAKYTPNVTDGKWHDVAIPLADFKTEDKDEWDDGSAWEFQIHNWAPVPRDFVAHVDDIRFE